MQKSIYFIRYLRYRFAIFRNDYSFISHYYMKKTDKNQNQYLSNSNLALVVFLDEGVQVDKVLVQELVERCLTKNQLEVA